MNAPAPARENATLLKTIALVPFVWVWMIFSACVSAFIKGFAGFRSWIDSQSLSVAMLVIALVVSTTLVAYIFGTWFFQCIYDKKPFRLLGFIPDKKTLPALILGVLSSVVIINLVVRALVLLGLAGEQRQMDNTSAPLWAGVLELLIFAFVLQGIGEELLFRGYLMQRFARTLKPSMAVVAAAVAFAIPHLMSNGNQEGVLGHLAYLAIPFGFAILAGALVYHTGSLWAAIGIHGGFHVAMRIIAAQGYQLDGNLMFLSVGAAFTAVGLLLLALLPRRLDHQVSDTVVAA